MNADSREQTNPSQRTAKSSLETNRTYHEMCWCTATYPHQHTCLHRFSHRSPSLRSIHLLHAWVLLFAPFMSPILWTMSWGSKTGFLPTRSPPELSTSEWLLSSGIPILQITFTTFMATPAFSYRCRNHICAFFRTVFLSLWILAWTWRMGTDGVHQQNLTFFQTSEFTMLNHEWTHWISADFSCNFSTILNPENTFLFVIMSIIFLP